jgi:hypothetical protein
LSTMTKTQKGAKKAPAKKPSRKARKPATAAATKTRKELKPMTENNQSSVTSTVETLLSDIAAKIGTLLQIAEWEAKQLAAQIAQPAATSVAQPAATDAPEKPAKPARANNQPGAETVGGLVWSWCDQLTKSFGRPCTKEELLQAIEQGKPTAKGAPINLLTAQTQYSKWRSARGLPALPRGFAARGPAVAQTAATSVAQPAPAPAPAFALPTMAVVPEVRAAVASVPAMPAMPAPAQQPTAPAIVPPPWLR